MKIKIQNGLIDHLSASQSVYEDVRNNYNQSNQCFDALKCQKCAKIVYCVELFTFTFVFTKSFVNEDRQKLVQRSANNVLQCFDALKCQKCAKIVYCVELFTFTFVFTKSFVNEDRQKLIRRSANNVLGTTYW